MSIHEEEKIEIEEEPEQDSEEPDEEKKEKEEEDTEDIAEKIEKAIEKAIDKRFPQKKAKTTPKHIRQKGDEEPDSQLEDRPTCPRCGKVVTKTVEGHYLCVYCRRLFIV
jgi:formamidopyrimidine-DNA glycosylase